MKIEIKNNEHISIVEINKKLLSEEYFKVFNPNDKVIALDFEAISEIFSNKPNEDKREHQEKYKTFFEDLGFHAKWIPVTLATTDEKMNSYYDEVISKVKLHKLESSIRKINNMLRILASKLKPYDKILVWGDELEKSVVTYMLEKKIIDEKHPLNNMHDLRDFLSSKDKKGRVIGGRPVTIWSNYGNGKHGDSVIVQNSESFFSNLASMHFGDSYDEIAESNMDKVQVTKLSSSLDVVSALITAYDNNEPLDSSVAFSTRKIFVEINRQFSYFKSNKLDFKRLEEYNIQDSEAIMKFYKKMKNIAINNK